MYPDNACAEFYPTEIVDKVLREHPGASVERLNFLMQREWDAAKREPMSTTQLTDS